MRKLLNELSSRELMILDIIHKQSTITKKNLQTITAMKLTTLNRIMKTLIDKKLVFEAGEAESTGGRKAAMYSIAETGVYVIGIDISRTYVKIIISNLKLTVLKEESFFMNNSFSPKETVKKIAAVLKQGLSELDIQDSEVLGIGIGTVGPIDRENGIMLNPKNFFNKEWTNVPLKRMIEKETSLPCFIDNGVNNAVMAEYLFGIGKTMSSIIYIQCGIGIRSAVITDGSLVRTMNDSEDAFAHMIVDANGEKCSCGNRGCIESYASINAITERYIHTKPQVTAEIEEENYISIFDLAKESNVYALEVINKGAEMLGIGLANLVRIVNPQLVILCGPLISSYKQYYDKCIESFHRNNCQDNKVIFSSGGHFKESAIAIGSCVMLIEKYLKNGY